MKISNADRHLLITLLKVEAIRKRSLMKRAPERTEQCGQFIKACNQLVIRLVSEESLLIDSQKPKITHEQMCRLLDSIDDVWAGKRPSLCSDGSCFEKNFAQQTDLIDGFFTIMRENYQ